MLGDNINNDIALEGSDVYMLAASLDHFQSLASNLRRHSRELQP